MIYLFFSVFLCLVTFHLWKEFPPNFQDIFRNKKNAINALHDTIRYTITQSDCKRYLCVALFWLYSTYHRRCNWISFISLKVIFFNVTAVCFCFCCVAIRNWNGTRANHTLEITKSKEDYFSYREFILLLVRLFINRVKL